MSTGKGALYHYMALARDAVCDVERHAGLGDIRTIFQWIKEQLVS